MCYQNGQRDSGPVGTVTVDPELLKPFKEGDVVLAKYNTRGELIYIRPLKTKYPSDFYLGKIDENGYLTRIAGVRVEGDGK